MITVEHIYTFFFNELVTSNVSCSMNYVRCRENYFLEFIVSYNVIFKVHYQYRFCEKQVKRF